MEGDAPRSQLAPCQGGPSCKVTGTALTISWASIDGCERGSPIGTLDPYRPCFRNDGMGS